jgi:hypothetical protein
MILDITELLKTNGFKLVYSQLYNGVWISNIYKEGMLISGSGHKMKATSILNTISKSTHRF